MTQWKTVLVQGALAGSLASLLSAAVLAIAGRRQRSNAAAPINAVSHRGWADEALRRQRADLEPTAAGYLAHHAAATLWATLYALLGRNQPALRTTPGALLGAAATSATACLADYQLTPRRFAPGFEHRLSSGALAGVYAAFAVGLAAGALALRDQYPDHELARKIQAALPAEEEMPLVVRRVRAGHI